MKWSETVLIWCIDAVAAAQLLHHARQIACVRSIAEVAPNILARVLCTSRATYHHLFDGKDLERVGTGLGATITGEKDREMSNRKEENDSKGTPETNPLLGTLRFSSAVDALGRKIPTSCHQEGVDPQGTSRLINI